MVILVRGGKYVESGAEFGVKRLGRVADNRQTAASRGTVFREGCDENVTTRSYDALNLLDVRSTISGIGEKMKDGAVVPDGIRIFVERSISNVRGNPPHPDCIVSQPVARDVERSLRDIQYCEIRVAGGEEIVDQNRCAGPDIDDGSRPIRSESRYELDRLACLLLEPAQDVDILRPIDRLPVSLLMHTSFRQIFIRKICHNATRRQGSRGLSATFSDPLAYGKMEVAP